MKLYKGGVLLIFFHSCFQAAFAARPLSLSQKINLQPQWAQGSIFESHNSSYFNPDRIPFQFDSRFKLLQKELLQDSLAYDEFINEYRGRIEHLYRDYEFKSRHHLLDVYEERRYFNNMSAIAHEMKVRAPKYQIDRNVGKFNKGLEKSIDKESGFYKAAEKPLGAAVAIAMFSMGRKISFKVTENVRMSSSLNLLNLGEARSLDPNWQGVWEYERSGNWEIDTPWVHSHLFLKIPSKGYRAEDWSPASPINPGQELYEVRLARHVPLLNIGTQVRYGGSSTTLWTGLTKPLTPHWSIGIEDARPMVVARSTASPDGVRTVRVNYEIRF